MPHTTENSSRSLERGPGVDLTSWTCSVPFVTSEVIRDRSPESGWRLQGRGKEYRLLSSEEKGRGKMLGGETWLTEGCL